MVRFCTSCGTGLTPDARFCPKCGTLQAEIVVEPVQAGPEIESGFPAVEPSPVADPQTDNYAPVATPVNRSNIGMIAAIVVTVLIVGLFYFWLFVWDDVSSTASESSTAEAAGNAEPTASQQLFTMTQANIRDKPTTAGSNIIGKLPRGSRVTGLVKMGEDGTTQWLILDEGKGFVAAVNLSETEPPVLAKALGDKLWTANGMIEIWSAPNSGSTLLDRVGDGTQLTLAGLTANDYIEIKLKKGGVGYIANGAEILARANGKPIVIIFSPQTCNFGGELETEFAKISTRLRAQWAALEAKEFPDEAARERAYANIEGKSAYVRLPRSYEGLSLTAIAQHYESQSVYFADPAAKVIEVFRSKGFRVGRDGSFPATDLYAGISATRGEGAAYGKSELGCGV